MHCRTFFGGVAAWVFEPAVWVRHSGAVQHLTELCALHIWVFCGCQFEPPWIGSCTVVVIESLAHMSGPAWGLTAFRAATVASAVARTLPPLG